MNKKLCSLFLLCFSFVLKAQQQNGVTQLSFMDASTPSNYGRIYVNAKAKNDPTQWGQNMLYLQVNDNGAWNFVSTYYDNLLRIDNIHGLRLGINNSRDRGYFFGDGKYTGVTTDIRNNLCLTTGGYKNFFFSTLGRLGIGTDIPDEKLDVKGNIAFSYGNGIKSIGNGFNDYLIKTGWSNNIGHDYVGFYVPGSVNTENTQFMTLLSNGNLGIGTTRPQEKLHVNGAVKVNQNLYLKGGLLMSYEDGYFDENSAYERVLAFRAMDMDNDDEGGYGFEWLSDSYLSSGKIPLAFKPDGSVVIGGTNYKTGYELTVNGEIACEKLMVELASKWPDYVFENDYSLMSLTEVESYIGENKHLPNVPSASDFELQGGVEVGEMQQLQMRKIEELTLYIIQLNKEKEETEKRLFEENEALKKRMELIEALLLDN